MEIPKGEVSTLEDGRHAVTCPHCGYPTGTNGEHGLQLSLCWFCRKYYVYDGVLVEADHEAVIRKFKGHKDNG